MILKGLVYSTNDEWSFLHVKFPYLDSLDLDFPEVRVQTDCAMAIKEGSGLINRS